MSGWQTVGSEAAWCSPHRWLRLTAVVLFALLFAIHDEARPRDLDAPFHEFMGSQEQIRANLQTFEVWRTRSAVPQHVGFDTIPQLAPPVYRILTPAIMYTVSHLPHPHSCLAAVRLLLITGFLLLVYLLSRAWLTEAGAATAMVLTAALLYDVPIPAIETRLHAVLMTGALMLLVAQRTAPLLVVYTLAALNREDALLIALAAALVWLLSRTGHDRRLLWTALACVGISVGIRAVAIAVVGHRPYYTDVVQLTHNLSMLKYSVGAGNFLHPDLNVVLPLFVMAAMSLISYRSKPSQLQAGPLVFWLYLASVLVIGRFHEVNKYPPLIAFVMPGVIWSLLPSLRRHERSLAGKTGDEAASEGEVR